VFGFDIEENYVGENYDEWEERNESGYPVGENWEMAEIEKENENAKDRKDENLRFLSDEFL